jgi:DNA-binding GntR family transcriptional regulator
MSLVSAERAAVDAPASVAAYEGLKRAIVTAVIPPATPLAESALMERFGVGRTPMREALQRLAGDGLVVIFPRRGMLVGQLGLSEIQQLFEARIAVEGETAWLAARRGNEEDRRSVVAINEAIHATEASRSFGSFLDVDQRFHREIVRVAQNRYLAEAADRILTLNEWLWHVHMTRYGVLSTDFASHDAVVAAVMESDPDAARRAMIDHIERSRALLRVAL